jgi:hypothetical protein
MLRLLRATVAAGLIVCAVAAITATRMPGAQAIETPSATAPSCHHISGPFHTVGARVLNSAGEQYIPYGINIPNLERPLRIHTVRDSERQIQAAATTWCANTVRLQISQALMVAPNNSIRKPFLDAVEKEVSFARSLGLLVALNLQDKLSRQYMPTVASEAFWGALATRYRNDPGVIFDIFNEPGNVKTWSFWRNGGVRDGIQYFGMQQLASFIRSTGAQNLLWIQGPHKGGSLKWVWRYQLRNVYPLMYDVHRPPRPYTVASWRRTFGYLVQENRAPVLDGEWADYARSNAWWACWNNAPASVPNWLNYLREQGIGMIATKLARLQLLESHDPADPTHFGSNWSCTTGLDQGAGSDVLRWFWRQNGSTLYAAASPTGTHDCSSAADACTLARAIADAGPGFTIDLVTSGKKTDASTWYKGGFSIGTAGTSAALPVTIQPAPGVTDPILDGGHRHGVLRVGEMFLDVIGVTIRGGQARFGGGISNNSGGTVSVSGSTFLQDHARVDGGAIDNGDNGGTGTLTVTGSTFLQDHARVDGGAVDNGDNGGTGTLTVIRSTLSGNRAQVDGGAIDNGDNGGGGTLNATSSTLSGNQAQVDGGAIDNGDKSGTGTLTVTNSTLSGNRARAHGNTVDNRNRRDHGVVAVGADIFAGSCARSAGRWHDEGYNVGSDPSCLNGGKGDDASPLVSFVGRPSYNGGGIRTILPLRGNPAVGIVPNPTPGLCPTIDERGAMRSSGRPCSAGAAQSAGPAFRPTVSSVSPRSGPVTGGTRITITGSDFSAGATVVIGQGGGSVNGAIRATDVRVVSRTKITATTGGPASKGRTWNVYVIDYGKRSAASAQARFRYAGPRPVVSSVRPGSVPVTGGTRITITGSGFLAGATVLIGQGDGAGPRAIRATKVRVLSRRKITAVTPASAKGTWNLYVNDIGGTSDASQRAQLTYVR